MVQIAQILARKYRCPECNMPGTVHEGRVIVEHSKACKLARRVAAMIGS